VVLFQILKYESVFRIAELQANGTFEEKNLEMRVFFLDEKISFKFFLTFLF